MNYKFTEKKNFNHNDEILRSFKKIGYNIYIIVYQIDNAHLKKKIVGNYSYQHCIQVIENNDCPFVNCVTL